jgi:hypothetical protein
MSRDLPAARQKYADIHPELLSIKNSRLLGIHIFRTADLPK